MTVWALVSYTFLARYLNNSDLKVNILAYIHNIFTLILFQTLYDLLYSAQQNDTISILNYWSFNSTVRRLHANMYSGTTHLYSRQHLHTYVEHVSGLSLSNNDTNTHATEYITKTISNGVHYDCYCLHFSNRISIAVKKKKKSVSAVVYTHCLICSQNIHMPSGAKVLKGRYTNTS